MTNFETWDQKNLSQFAYECQAEIKRLQEERNRLHLEIVGKNNKYGSLLIIVKELMDEYVYFMDLYNRTPEKQKAYMKAMEIFK